jgi:hypothetical protein
MIITTTNIIKSLFLLLSIFIVVTATGDQVDITATQDAYVESNQPNTPHNNDRLVIADSSNVQSYSLLEFSLLDVPRDSRITSVQLIIPLLNSFSYPNDGLVEVRLIQPLQTWNEDTVTFNNRPTESDFIALINLTNTQVVTVTDIVRGLHIACEDPVIGFYLKRGTVNDINIELESKEGNGNVNSPVDSVTQITLRVTFEDGDPLISTDKDILCEGESARIARSNQEPADPIQYSWLSSTDELTIIYEQNRNYSMTASYKGCSRTESVIVREVPTPVAVLTASTDVIYIGYKPSELKLNCHVIRGSGPFTYSINNDQFSESPNRSISPTRDTEYRCTVSGENGCRGTSNDVSIKVVDVRCGTDNTNVTLCNSDKQEICVTQDRVCSLLCSGATLGLC